MSDSRALVLGAETAAGAALAAALAEAGARIAIVAAGTDPDDAFGVQRLSRRIGASAQAIDATNEMAVRVMTRQVSKTLGGLDLLIFSAALGDRTNGALALACRFAAREMARAGGGTIAIATPGGAPAAVGALVETYASQGVRVVALDVPPAPDDAWAREALGRLAGPPPAP